MIKRNLSDEVFAAMCHNDRQCGYKFPSVTFENYGFRLIENQGIYLSGPVTGLDRDEVERVFYLAEKVLYDQGAVRVFNPIREIPEGTEWTDAMIKCLDTLESGLYSSMVLLPGWEKSNGCCMEAYFALKLDNVDIAVWDLIPQFAVAKLVDGSDDGLYCKYCGRYHEHDWEYCPYCGTKVF